MTYQPVQPAQPVPLPENVNRGTVVALLTIPAGVIVWVIIWSIGFIASIVSFGVALLAMFLYKLGSGGQMGRAGAVRVTIITVVTVALSILAGLVADVAIGIATVTGTDPVTALSNPVFSQVFTEYTTGPDSGSLVPSLLLSVGFGILGCFSILRSAFKKTAAPVVNPATGQPWSQSPITPGQPQQLWPQNPTIPPTEDTPPR